MEYNIATLIHRMRRELDMHDPEHHKVLTLLVEAARLLALGARLVEVQCEKCCRYYHEGTGEPKPFVCPDCDYREG